MLKQKSARMASDDGPYTLSDRVRLKMHLLIAMCGGLDILVYTAPNEPHK